MYNLSILFIIQSSFNQDEIQRESYINMDILDPLCTKSNEFEPKIKKKKGVAQYGVYDHTSVLN